MASDPRQQDAIVPYHLPAEMDGDTDWAGNIAMYVSMVSVVLRNQFKTLPWVAAYFGLASFLNSRRLQKSRSDILGNQGYILAAASLFTFYLNLYFGHRRALAQLADPSS